MILMALDHTRAFLSAARFAPLDLAYTTPALFLTQWVTHFCAPVFFLLAGLGASLALARGRTVTEMSRLLLTRGLWLVLLELTVIAVGWYFTFRVVPVTANAIGAPPPRRVPTWLARMVIGYQGVAVMTENRGCSSQKAKAALDWRPRYPSWRTGFSDGLW